MKRKKAVHQQANLIEQVLWQLLFKKDKSFLIRNNQLEVEEDLKEAKVGKKVLARNKRTTKDFVHLILEAKVRKKKVSQEEVLQRVQEEAKGYAI